MYGNHRIFLFLILLFICGLSVSGFTAQNLSKQQTGKTSQIDVSYYDLALQINIQDSSIQGSNKIYFTAKENLENITIDLFSNFKIEKITCREKDLQFSRKNNKIHIALAEKMLAGTQNDIEIFYSGKPKVAVKPPWDGGFIWAKDSLNRPWIAVACEQLGASSWWPCKDDLSDEPDSVSMHFTVPKSLVCISNGQLKSKTEKDGFTTYNWHVSYPINLYNVTLNIGNYRNFTDTFTSLITDENGRKITYPLDYYFLDYDLEKAKAFFADSLYARTKKMLHSFEKLFGVYPFYRDGYALVETPFWGMEHQGAVAYGNNFQLNNFGFDFILVHESGHEWWGNAVSCADAGDMWIHESFTTYAEALYVEQQHGYEQSIAYLKMQKPLISNEKPVQGPRNINFHERTDNDIYYKGSWVLHTLRSVLNNDSIWFAMLHGLQQEFQYKTIATENVISYMEKFSGKDLKAFFAQYLYENKLPVLQLKVKNKNGKSVIMYRWASVVKGFEMPVEILVKGQKFRFNVSEKFRELPIQEKIEVENIKIDFGRFLIERN